MGRAGRALKAVLENYGISQSRLAVVMGVERTVVHRWTSEKTDPTGETITAITEALKQINPHAAREFIERYLGDIIEDRNPTQEEE